MHKYIYYAISKRLPSNIVKPAISYSLLSLRISRSNYVGSLGNRVPKKSTSLSDFYNGSVSPNNSGCNP